MEFPLSITKGREHPVEDLFSPALENSERFDVGVGYFTSAWFSIVAPSAEKFFLNGGRMRWVISPNIHSGDEQILANTESAGAELLDEQLEQQLKLLDEETKAVLCFLVAKQILQFKIALPKKSTTGLFHAKFGIFYDSSGKRIAFSGSYNLTANAQENWEHLDVFSDQDRRDNQRIAILQNNFSDLWEDRDPNYRILRPSENILQYMRAHAPLSFPKPGGYEQREKQFETYKLRGYQERAIDAWGKKHNGRGLFVMATGTGKTFTALMTLKKLSEILARSSSKGVFAVIVVPMQHLLDQWSQECQKLGFLNVVSCYKSKAEWQAPLNRALTTHVGGSNETFIALVTNKTLSDPSFQRPISQIPADQFMLIVDEAHNIGSSSGLDALPKNAKYRLGLTATPHRYKDPEGTKRLYSYFGDECINYTIIDAIDAGYLSPYDYVPHICEMTVEEYSRYQLNAEEIALAKEDPSRRDLDRLYGIRADILTRVSNKTTVLLDSLASRGRDTLSHILVYCGQQRGEQGKRHIEVIVEELGAHRIRCRKFTAEETTEERKAILDDFDAGEISVLAAIRCLDEGVDVPSTKEAYFLESSSNPKQFIQRRGRVLRLSEGKEKAILHDFLVCPPYDHENVDDLIDREIMRANEFISASSNPKYGKEKLNDFIYRYGK
jgi:superfamily II DNA or RNA helicase